MRATADNQYPRVGIADPGSQVYELVIGDFLQILTPPRRFDLVEFDPNDYFVTSGDAVQKTKYMCGIVWSYAGDARKQLNEMKHVTVAAKKFEKLCWRQAGAVRKMLNALIAVRGEDVFLETEWNEHQLFVIPKNPRSVSKKNKEQAGK